MTRRLRPVPRHKTDKADKGAGEIVTRQMTAEEFERMPAPRERDMMTWGPAKRKEVDH
ncbi:hypothetical protein SAMN04487969_102454 [Paenibacillus algorifonticola]|uniref:Uncharacterized protein n=1 Tax=Paenibacillus algorifonticola TaxID=684063 RepID=A0A1I2AHL4_9BACL|nr:hypothetical protein SAMN04487969_102454 [Paenibacillus algorifonticola]